MKVVWKFELYVGPNEVWMPVGAELLSVAEQEGRLQLWALTDPSPTVRHENRRIEVWITGAVYAIQTPVRFVGTIHCTAAPNAGIVLHVFEHVR